MIRRNLCFILAATVSAIAFWMPLRALVGFSLHSAYSYIPVIPLISACLIYLEKKRIFREIHNGFGPGVALLVLAIVLLGFGKKYSGVLSQNHFLSLMILSLVMLWTGTFVLFYGVQAFRAAAFPVLLLLLMVPIPEFLYGRTVLFLQNGSVLAASAVFKAVGVPVLQQGVRLSLPGIDVDVAEQCCGIRSCLALFITGLLMGHIFFRSLWSKLSLCVVVIAITIFKNGLRIVTLSLLTLHPEFTSFTRTLHRYGGIPFSLLGLLLLAPVVWSLRQLETIQK